METASPFASDLACLVRRAAASAAIDCMKSWVTGTPEGDWVSMSVVSDGSYGVPEGIISSFPCICRDGDYEIVQGLDINEFSREKMAATEAELREERDGVAAGCDRQAPGVRHLAVAPQQVQRYQGVEEVRRREGIEDVSAVRDRRGAAAVPARSSPGAQRDRFRRGCE